VLPGDRTERLTKTGRSISRIFYDLSAKPLDPLNPLGLDNKNADLQIVLANMGANCVN